MISLISEGVEVSVETFYQQDYSNPIQSEYMFAYRIAIENYLEPVMNHYVVQTQAEAIQAIRLLSDSSKGRANFFVLEALQSIPESARPEIQNPNLIPALSIVDIDEKYGRLCRQLLNNVYILTAGDEEELGNSMPESNIVILSGKGKFSKSRISMAGGSVGLFEGKAPAHFRQSRAGCRCLCH